MHRAEDSVLAANPAPDAGFLVNPEQLTPEPERAPFDRMWTSGAPRGWRSFPKLYVAAIDTGHVSELTLWNKLTLLQPHEVALDTVLMAVEFRERLEKAFREDPLQRYQVLESPDAVDANTAVLEVALVELVPNKAALGVIGLVAWGAPLQFGIPVATATAFIGHGSIAMEARVRDGGTGQVVAMFADRETGRARVIDLRSLTWWANAREVLGDWTDALFAVATTPPDEKVEHSPLFTFLLW